MSLFDNLKDKAEKLIKEHGDQVESGLDKAAALVDDKTGGKYTDKIERATDAAHSAVDKMAAHEPPPPAAP